MNKYGLVLNKKLQQSILPVMTRDGRVYGFYSITKQGFDGTETELELSDGYVVPITSVTVDQNKYLRSQTQFMAAVWPIGLPFTSRPWEGTALFVAGNPQAYRWFSMPTQGWDLHFNKGFLVDSLISNIEKAKYAGQAAIGPEGEDAAMTWQASLDYRALLGDSAFFDFNWKNVFKAKSDLEPASIYVISNPAPTPPSVYPSLKATVVGIPIETSNGVLYDTIRVLKLVDHIEKGEYEFKFKIRTTNDLSKYVKLILTVV